MQPGTTDKSQVSFLLPDLESQLDPRNLLFRLVRAIDWSGFEKDFRSLYCTEGRPALPIRRLLGLLMLKSLRNLRNLSDEEVVVFWSENPYAQHFCGEREMRWGLPCDPSELTHFRKRIGTGGGRRFWRLRSPCMVSGRRKKKWSWTRRFRNRSEAQIDCRRQPKGRGVAESKEHYLSNRHKIVGQDRARRGENGEASWGEVEAKFRAHGAEIVGSAEGASNQRRSRAGGWCGNWMPQFPRKAGTGAGWKRRRKS